MFCPNCGANLPDDAKFCAKCGAKLDAGAQSGGHQAPTHVDVPMPRKTQQMQAVGSERGAETEIVKPKKKLPLKIIGIIAVITVLLAALLFVITHFVAVPSEAYIVLSDGHYELFTNLDDPEFLELASYKSDDSPVASLVRFDPTKKYVYFITKYSSNDNTGTLCRAEWKKLKKNSSKNDQYIETIATNVITYSSYLKFLDDGNFCYLNSDKILYYYNGEESIRVAKSVYSYDVDDKGRILYRVKDDNDEYTLYGTNVSNPDTKTKLASSVCAVYDADDFDNILYVKETKDGEEYLYTVGFEKDAAKLFEDDVDYITSRARLNRSYDNEDYDSGCIITVNNGTKIDWSDYFTSSTDEYIKELFDYALMLTFGAADDGEEELKDLYYYNKGELTLLAENVVYEATGYTGGFLYLSSDASDVIDLSSDDDIEKIAEEMQDYLFDHVKAVVTNAKTPAVLSFSSAAAEAMKEAGSSNSFNNLVFTDGFAFLQENVDEIVSISAAKVENGEVGGFTLIADDACDINVINDSLYYKADAYSDDGTYYGDIYAYDGKGKLQIVKDASAIRLYDDGNKLVYNNEGVNILSKNGQTTWLAESAYPIYNLDGTHYLYVSDEDAYMFDGKSNKMIAADAEYVWSSEYVSETADLGL